MRLSKRKHFVEILALAIAKLSETNRFELKLSRPSGKEVA